MKRRTFIKTGSLAAIAATSPMNSFSENPINKVDINIPKLINFTRDGLDFSPLEYSQLLLKISTENGIQADSYSRHGMVEKLETKMAKILGKESAVFMPTGTLANNIAIKQLAEHNDRVIVQAESHLYNDSGDGAQKLNHLNLISLAPKMATFTLDEVKDVVARTKAGRVKTGVGVISIESPVRRKDNEMFDFEEMKKIHHYASEKGIRMHLDGARLFNACIHENKSPAEFAQMFDTVYVSLYKNFNAASGAILAGTKEFTKDLYHVRRMFGGGMPQVWPFATVAYQYVDSFLHDYAKTVKQADELFELLMQNKAFKIEKITHGSNVIKLFVDVPNRVSFRTNLKKKGIVFPTPEKSFNGFKIKINPSILKSNPKDLAAIITNALK